MIVVQIPTLYVYVYVVIVIIYHHHIYNHHHTVQVSKVLIFIHVCTLVNDWLV